MVTKHALSRVIVLLRDSSFLHLMQAQPFQSMSFSSLVLPVRCTRHFTDNCSWLWSRAGILSGDFVFSVSSTGTTLPKDRFFEACTVDLVHKTLRGQQLLVAKHAPPWLVILSRDSVFSVSDAVTTFSEDGFFESCTVH